MLTYKVLPDHIKKVAEEYNQSNERLDCLPSKLQVGNKSYYVVHYYPLLNDLFTKQLTDDSGIVPGSFCLASIE